MKRISIGTVVRMGAAATLIAGALGLAAPSEAAPFKRLFATLATTHPGCTTSPEGELFFANATGQDSAFNTVCETASNGSTSQAFCNNSAVRHKVILGRLQTVGLMTLFSSNQASQPTWTNFAIAPGFAAPSHAGCPAGNTLTAMSFGKAYNLP